MERDDLDRWLSDDDTLVPSSGFAASVMDAVRSEAIESEAIPFPWKRVLPGVIVGAMALASLVVIGLLAFSTQSAQALPDRRIGALVALTFEMGTTPEVAWVAFGAILTVVPAMLLVRLTRDHS